MTSLALQPQFLSQSQFGAKPEKRTKASIFYVNDVHAHIPNMERLKSAYDEFERKEMPGDKLVFVQGDTSIGEDKNLNKLAVEFQNQIGTMASVIGNHELDLEPKNLIENNKDANFKILGFNTDIDPSSELKNEVTKSYVQEVNGSKYGIIGLIPFDYKYHVKDGDRYSVLNLIDFDKTVPLVQKQIDEFKKQGVNKIIVVSHSGYDNDVRLAKAVEGIDVILGGHSHDLLEGVQWEKNLFYSDKTGEPTLITQVGKDGKYFGVLNLEFDKNGVIKQAQNNVSKSGTYPRSFVMNYFVDNILGPTKIIGVIKSAPPVPHQRLMEPNPHLSFVADAVKDQLNVDIAMLNSGNIRAGFEPGRITERDLSGILPFKNKMCITQLTEKELVDAIKVGAKSMVNQDGRPGLLQFSGLKYVINTSGELKELYIIRKDGNDVKVNVDNPNPFVKYSVAMDDFVAKRGNDYLISDKWEAATVRFDYDKDKLVSDYIKKLNKPIEIKSDGRLQIVD